jgi:monofunctional biosynthetic peptidoglycan transglycosylase
MARAGGKKRSSAKPMGGVLRGLRRLLGILVLIAVVGPVLWVLLYRFVGPPITILMVERMIEGRGLDHRWVPLNRIAPAMTRAVIASEDSRFCEHHGFDVKAIDAAIRHNEKRPGRIRGGSTISQQTAKNVFLWPQRSWVRKGAEAWFTVLIELLWGKRRIMEVYLNTVEMGPGIYGVEAASRRYFGIPAEDLSTAEAGRLAAILPDPLKWKAARPGPYVLRRTGRIEARSSVVARGGLARCVFD